MGNKLKFSKIKKAILLPSLLFMLGRTNCPAVLSAEAQQQKTSVSTTTQAQNFVFTKKNLDEIKTDTETIINLINKYNTDKCSKQDLVKAFANFGPRLIANFNLLASDYEKLEKNNLKQFKLTSKEMTEIYNANGQNTDYTRNLEVACVDIPHAMHLFSQTFGLIFTRAEYADILKIDENDQKNEWCLINAKEGKRDFSNETNAILDKVIKTIFEYARFYYWGTNTNYNSVNTNLTTMRKDMNVKQETIQETANILKAIKVDNTNMFGNSLLCDAIVAEIRLQGSLVVLADKMKQKGQDINKLIPEALNESLKQQARQQAIDATNIINPVTNTPVAAQISSDTVVPTDEKVSVKNTIRSGVNNGITWAPKANVAFGNGYWGLGVGVTTKGTLKNSNVNGTLGAEIKTNIPYKDSDYLINTKIIGSAGLEIPTPGNNIIDLAFKLGGQNGKNGNSGFVVGFNGGYKLVFDNFSIDFGAEVLHNVNLSITEFCAKIGVNYYDHNNNTIWVFSVGYTNSDYKKYIENTNIPSSTTPGGTTTTNGGTTPTNGGSTPTNGGTTNRGKDLPTIPINMNDQTMWR